MDNFCNLLWNQRVSARMFIHSSIILIIPRIYFNFTVPWWRWCMADELFDHLNIWTRSKIILRLRLKPPDHFHEDSRFHTTINRHETIRKANAALSLDAGQDIRNHHQVFSTQRPHSFVTNLQLIQTRLLSSGTFTG